MSDLPDAISLREVGPRDGLQNEDPVPTAAKVALIDALSRTGVGRIEAVSFVHPKAIPQMADADDVWSRIERNGRRALLRARAEPARRAARPRRGASARSRSSSRPRTPTTARTSTARRRSPSTTSPIVIAKAHDAGATCQVIVSTAWGCPYEGDVPESRVVEVASRAVRDGADGISFGDTTGMATPARVRRLIGEFRSAYPEVPLNVHFHNTRGTGLANVLTALELGVADFDASVGGLGGCPYAPGATGNIATEELVHMVEDMGVATGVDLDALVEVAAEAERIVGRTLSSQVLRAGPRTRTIRHRPD